MKEFYGPIQIADGKLACPSCAGDVLPKNAVGIGHLEIMIVVECGDCKGIFGLRFASCEDRHTHVGWVEMTDDIKPDRELN